MKKAGKQGRHPTSQSEGEETSSSKSEEAPKRDDSRTSRCQLRTSESDVESIIANGERAELGSGTQNKVNHCLI
jgi:hypothetical protein